MGEKPTHLFPPISIIISTSKKIRMKACVPRLHYTLFPVIL